MHTLYNCIYPTFDDELEQTPTYKAVEAHTCADVNNTGSSLVEQYQAVDKELRVKTSCSYASMNQQLCISQQVKFLLVLNNATQLVRVHQPCSFVSHKLLDDYPKDPESVSCGVFEPPF